MGMKGGNVFRLRSKHLSITLTALVGTTILLWAWENSPLVASWISAQDTFVMPSSEILMGTLTPMDTLLSIDSKTQMEKDFSDSFLARETRIEETEEGLTTRIEDDSELFAENKDCNYAKGKWVADRNRPLYSGLGCKEWLSEMWACRLTQRPDFFYEAFRWQPENCKIPEFDRSTFFRRMKDRTIAFVGDSLGRQQFQSLMCMVTGGKESPDVHNIGPQYGLVKARGAVRPDGWAYRFSRSNTTILYYWSATLCDLEPLNVLDPKTEYAMHLDKPVAFLRKYLHRFDVLVLNTGHHWNRGKLVANRWVMYVDGLPNNDKKLAPIGNAKNFTVHSVVKWLDSKFPQHPRLKAFFTTISPRHFFNGDWNTGGTCDNTIPLAGGSEVSQDESSDPVIENAVKNTNVKILDITALSQLRDEGHISRYTIRPSEGMQDCLHWCLPGVPDAWNEILYAQL
ncbi:trichome birefringence-like [Thalictrum thalictroides]|uniref:Trichome birefringence-like n=1 Tax=Thalictrum thalictroides TaxID=46969 RepID=A0A7J6VID2_THATH|nr:trichome birefringence-like [Thalictrum thalictroides]